MSSAKKLLCWFILAVMILAVMGACQLAFGIEQPKAYSDAFRQAKKDGKVLAVLIGMQNCPACADIASDKRHGEVVLRRLPHYVKIMVEDYPDLAKDLTRSKHVKDVACPQLCCFWYRKGKWVAERYVGSDKIKAFVQTRLYYVKKKPVLPVLRQ